ncbi:MAG: tRNA lysidine(34) synthetase TilS [Verrucomicrobia bacterium]|jgi:tRNA(Ile)-lysidine synthase|nr:tRNA lysidine(34) synthetase TilS [Verrucomicrobiota bacterium]
MSAAREAVRCIEAAGAEEFPHPECRAFFTDLPAGATLLAACSGGGDSVFMVLVLAALAHRLSLRLELVHVHHGLRAAAADADAVLVDELGRELGLPVHQRRVHPLPDAGEADLRDLRYRELAEVYRRAGASALCLGHQADDLVESQLMALLTGTGPAGLASPRPRRQFADGTVRLRPILQWRREDLRERLAAWKVAFREDASNAESGPLRNYLRLEILPALQRRAPQDLIAAAASTRARMAEQLALLDHLVRGSGIDLADPVALDLRSVVPAPRALLRELILRWWFRHQPGRELARPAVESVLDALGGPVSAAPSIPIAPGRHLTIREGGWIRLVAIEGNALQWRLSANWAWPSGPLFLPDRGRLEGTFSHWETGQPPPYQYADPDREAWLALSAEMLVVRPWRAGDRYRPLGAPGSRKLQDLFTDAKLSPEQKATLPVVTDADGEIVWIPGFPPCDALRIQPGGNWALRLTYQPPSSGFPNYASWRRNPTRNATSP